MATKTKGRAPKDNPPAGHSDPMGLVHLGEVVSRLARLKVEVSGRGTARPGRWVPIVGQLEQSFAVVAEKYELLRDRYALLKRSNAQLAEELSWLRDQCDDLASGRPVGPPRETGGPGDGAKPRRRYSDRWRR
jgi:hypothetical protein